MFFMAKTPRQLTDLLEKFFQAHRYPPDERGGVFHGSTRPIARLGLALEPTPELNEWVFREKLDALWLHRPWQLHPAVLPPGVGVLFHHLPFDETLTLGHNRPLAAALKLEKGEALGHKQAPGFPPRAIGMVGEAPAGSLAEWLERLAAEFGGHEAVLEGSGAEIRRVAVVGAMTDALVREAADRGALLYLTGQVRQPARRAVEETGMNVIALGHRRSEEWGLRALADVLRAEFPDVEGVVYPSFLPNSAGALSGP